MYTRDKRIPIIQEMRKNRYTYREIAKTLGITRQRIYQILAKENVDNSKIEAKKSDK